MPSLDATQTPFAVPAPPTIRRIGTADLNWALAEGWSDFREKRGDLLFAGLLYPILGFVAAAAFLNQQLLPIFLPVVAGLSIMGPAVCSGFYELARRRQERLDASWWHFLDPLRGRSRAGIALLTGGLLALFVAWLGVAWLIYQTTLGTLHPVGVDGFIRSLVTTPQGWALIGLGNLAGFGFAVVTLVLTVVSFPMVVDRPVDAVIAVQTSAHAVGANPGVMAQWGLRVALLLGLGCVPAFVGLAVVLPVLGYATWHLYTRLVQR